jgi:multiple sugar transport system ATP-binding protein
MATVVLKDVRKSFDATEVIHGVSAEIPEGEFVVLVGPSGCGKSTLLRMIAGLEDVTGGEIRIDGRLVNDVPPKARDVAMVFQNYALYPHMTVAENMGFSLRMRGERRDVIDRKVREAAAILALDPYLDRLPRQLSGGQRQRVAMGRSIVRAPRVFLFDEPLSNLDAKLRVQMRAEIKDLHQRLKTTTVYVTHDQVEAMTLASRIVVLKDGMVEQIGPPLDLYDRPANLFVAGFIGSPAMNILNGYVVRRDDRPSFVVEGGASLELGDAVELSDGAAVTAGIRPEHLTIGASGLPAEVVVVEQTGSETHVVLRLIDTRVIVVSRERLELAPGALVYLSAAPGRVHLFDSGTGRRIVTET